MPIKREYLREDLVRDDGSSGILKASQCIGCGRLFFPGRDICPECGGSEFETVSLPDMGRLYTYTIVRMPAAHYDPPYAIGWVEFTGGLRVFGMIDEAEDFNLKIGMEMKTVVSVLWKDGEREVIAYKFVPLH